MTSRRQLVVDDLLFAARSMSEGSGYNFDWKQWWKYRQFEYPEHPSGSLVEEREAIRDLAHPKMERVLGFTLEAEHVVQSTHADAPSDTARQMIEDLERCILADPTRGGNAVDTRVTGNEMWVGDELAFVRVEGEILYHTNRQDPGANT